MFLGSKEHIFHIHILFEDPNSFYFLTFSMKTLNLLDSYLYFLLGMYYFLFAIKFVAVKYFSFCNVFLILFLVDLLTSVNIDAHFSTLYDAIFLRIVQI